MDSCTSLVGFRAVRVEMNLVHMAVMDVFLIDAFLYWADLDPERECQAIGTGTSGGRLLARSHQS